MEARHLISSTVSMLKIPEFNNCTVVMLESVLDLGKHSEVLKDKRYDACNLHSNGLRKLDRSNTS